MADKRRPAIVLPPRSDQMDNGIVPLEHVRGDLDIASVSIFDLIRYTTVHRIPPDARITANTFHDQPYIELT